MNKDNLKTPGTLLKSAEVSGDDMDRINALAMRELKPEEVFTFKLRACDDLVDRDHERFTLSTLHGLADKFGGKPVLMDHHWSAHVQTARCYKAEVQEVEGGHALIAHCYIPNLEQYRETIDAISTGILRECSVGVGIQRCTCSICGKNLHRCECEHIAGRTYDGQLCVGLLEGAEDVYEVSLVAVPAQPAAGVVKSAKGSEEEPDQEEKDKAEREHRKAMAQARQRLEELRFGGM